ncbi:Glu/Leu/Phe/Val family dehydrogenase [Tistrella mobilis]
MSVFSCAAFDGHEQVVFGHDPETGLKAIVAIHSTVLGPGVGGCRMWAYPDDASAVTDVLRLARGMTYKNAMAGLDFGGAKAVILGDARRDKTPAMMRAFGRFVDSLAGRYITAEDVGIGTDDMAHVRRETGHVLGLAETSGDPSPFTALGVFLGIRAALAHARGSDDLTGVTVAVQGLGHVGADLARRLHEAGARLVVADIHRDATDRVAAATGARVVDPAVIHAEPVDVYAPCALGAVLNDRTIPEIRAGIIAGAANNQLAEPRHARMLADRGVLYAPDYVINAGGVINIAVEHGPAGYDAARATALVHGIGDTMSRIFAEAARTGRTTAEVADAMAEARIRAAAAKKKAADAA